MKKILVLLAIGFTFASCSTVKKSDDKNAVQLSGTVEKAGMTTYQYGTHTLKSADKTYALKSSTVNLDSYDSKVVNLKGVKVAGYPIENGPELIEVTEVTVK